MNVAREEQLCSVLVERGDEPDMPWIKICISKYKEHTYLTFESSTIQQINSGIRRWVFDA